MDRGLFTAGEYEQVRAFFAARPHLQPTPLHDLPTLAHTLGVGRVLVKDETARFGLNAFKLLAPGGLLMTYSCSGGIGIELFQKIVAGAALDAGRTARIVQRLQGAADHPVDLAFPEGEYLKGLLLQVD